MTKLWTVKVDCNLIEFKFQSEITANELMVLKFIQPYTILSIACEVAALQGKEGLESRLKDFEALTDCINKNTLSVYEGEFVKISECVI